MMMTLLDEIECAARGKIRTPSERARRARWVAAVSQCELDLMRHNQGPTTP